MQVCHAAASVSARFDEPNLIADAGLLSLVRLAERAGLPELAASVRIEGADNSGGANPAAKVMSLLRGRKAGSCPFCHWDLPGSVISGDRCCLPRFGIAR
jgi:hypothetical protein